MDTNNTEREQAMREEFEVAAKAAGMEFVAVDPQGGEYYHWRTRYAYEGWKLARAALSLPAAASPQKAEGEADKFGFWKWLTQAYRDGEKEGATFTAYNMEAAFQAGISAGKSTMQIDLDEEETRFLADFLMASSDPDELAPCSLSFGQGFAGIGLYAWETEYPEEGATPIAIKEPSQPVALAAPAQPAEGAEPDAECPKCGAPCKTQVLMRGGDHGWGTTDAERTVYRYASQPADKDEEIAALKAGISGLKMQLEKCREGVDKDVARELLKNLLSAIEYRSACLTSHASSDKQSFADEKFWDAYDAAKAAMSTGAQKGDAS